MAAAATPVSASCLAGCSPPIPREMKQQVRCFLIHHTLASDYLATCWQRLGYFSTQVVANLLRLFPLVGPLV